MCSQKGRKKQRFIFLSFLIGLLFVLSGFTFIQLPKPIPHSLNVSKKIIKSEQIVSPSHSSQKTTSLLQARLNELQAYRSVLTSA